MFEAHKKKGSTTWNSILKAFKLLKDGFRFKVGEGHTSFWFTPWLDKEPLASCVPYVDIHDVELKICDVWVDDSWQLETLYTRLPNDLVNKLLHVVPRLASGLEDTWVWGECSSGLYCVSTAYHMLMKVEHPHQDLNLNWEWLWKLKLPSNIQFFLWEFCRHVVPIKAVLHVRGVFPSDTCPRCTSIPETLLHCFFTCSHVHPVWQALDLQDYATPLNTNMGTLLSWVHEAVLSYTTVVSAILWSLWIARNMLIFENERPLNHVICSRVYSLINSITRAFDWVPAKKHGTRTVRDVAWQGAPDDRTVALNVDGSCQGNSGRGSYGGLLRDHTGTFIFGFFGSVGLTSILHAELLGILHGIQCR